MTSVWWTNSSSCISRMSTSSDSALMLPYPMILLSVPSSHQYTLSFCHLSKHITGVSWFILFAHYLSLFCSWLNSVHLTRCTSSLYIVASLYQLRPFFFLWIDGESQKRNRSYWKNEMETQNWRVHLILKKAEIQMNV